MNENSGHGHAPSMRDWCRGNLKAVELGMDNKGRRNIRSGLAYVGRLAWKRLVGRPLSQRTLRRQSDFIFQSDVGLKFHIRSHDLVSRAIVLDGLYERQFVEFINAELPDGAVIVDIGANIGNHALYLARRASVVHCFEPNPEALAELRYNIRLNDAQNLIVHEIGLGATDGDFPFLVNEAGNIGNSGFESFTALREDDAHSRKLTLPVRHADREIARLDLQRLDYIKMDVEGMEVDIIESLRSTVARYRPIISFEYHAHLVPSTVFDRIVTALPDYAFAYAEMLGPGEGGLGVLSKHWALQGHPSLRQLVRPELRSYENLLAIPNESALAARIPGRQ